jgi:hypothetical protein
LQVSGEPASRSRVHATPSSQVVGQLPSHDSPGSTVPLPHEAPQSESSLAVHDEGQQPSPSWQIITDDSTHSTLHRSGSPRSSTSVHASGAPQVVGQLPSQSSFSSTIPFPQTLLHSESVDESQPSVQQPSPS